MGSLSDAHTLQSVFRNGMSAHAKVAIIPIINSALLSLLLHCVYAHTSAYIFQKERKTAYFGDMIKNTHRHPFLERKTYLELLWFDCSSSSRRGGHRHSSRAREQR